MNNIEHVKICTGKVQILATQSFVQILFRPVAIPYWISTSFSNATVAIIFQRYFKPGNVVQLVAKNTGKVVQLVEKDGSFTVDALGAEGADNANGMCPGRLGGDH